MTLNQTKDGLIAFESARSFFLHSIRTFPFFLNLGDPEGDREGITACRSATGTGLCIE